MPKPKSRAQARFFGAIAGKGVRLNLVALAFAEPLGSDAHDALDRHEHQG